MNVYPNPAKDNRAGFSISVFQVLTAAVFLWILSGFWQLQIQSPKLYARLAEANRVKSLPRLAPRGKILDRDGRVLVDNSPSFKVLLSRASAREENLAVIADGLGIPLEDIQARLRRVEGSNRPKYEGVIIKENLSYADVAFVESHRRDLPAIELIHSQRRLYPRGGLASHVIGYVGEISDSELEQLEFALYEPGDDVGKAGLERQYNDVLSGADGSELVLVDSQGRQSGAIGSVEAQPGRNLRLTLDLDLQVVAELALENRRGAAVALDPRNGEVLALVSSPNYDPNKFVGGIGRDDWRALTSDPDKPLLHRAIQAQVAPGSVFKPIVALAARELNVVGGDFVVECTGGAVFHGHYFSCNRRGGHGKVGLFGALSQSCNVYFYHLGNRLGIDRLAEFAELVGFGRASGIDLPAEEEGIVPSTRWKLRHYREKWYAGETISVAIGQGALTVTPLQVAHAIGGLAMGGEWHSPHLVPYDEVRRLRPNFEPPAVRRIEVDKKNVQRIVRGMWGSVNAGGTGSAAHLPGYDVCGKTGSAQVVSNKPAEGADEERFKAHAWFVGFAPCESPEIVVSVLLENGGQGSLAAPIARDVIKAYFDKKRRAAWTRLRGRRSQTGEAALAVAAAEPLERRP